MENINQLTPDIVSSHPKVSVLQKTLPILFLFLLLLNHVLIPILIKNDGEAFFISYLSTGWNILFWALALYIAKTKALRIACALFLVRPIVFNILFGILPNSTPTFYFICIANVIYYAYAFSIFFNYAKENNNGITKWLILWISLTIVQSVVWYGFEYIALSYEMMLKLPEDTYNLIINIFGKGSKYFLSWIVEIFTFAIYWNVFRSNLFSGYDKDSLLKPDMPVFFNRYVIGAFTISAISIGILNVWLNLFVL